MITGDELRCVPNEKQFPPPPSKSILLLSIATLVCPCSITKSSLSAACNVKYITCTPENVSVVLIVAGFFLYPKC